MGHDLFISYSSKDKVAAGAVLAASEAAGVRCWMAPRDILGGQKYAEAIVVAIRQARAMVLVFSASANQSEQVLREVERAVSRGLPVITFNLDATTPTGSFEYFLMACHWLPADQSPTVAQLAELTRGIQGLLGSGAGRAPSTAQGRGAPRPGVPGARGRRKVPPLLPYMADRQQQEERFAQELAGRLLRRPAVPVVCVVHGDEDQCHDKFLDRLRHRLPALLDDRGAGGQAPLTCRLDCRCPAPDPAVLASRWGANLADVFGLRPGTPLEEVSRAVAAASSPLLIEASVWSTDWRQGARPLLDALTGFLESWPAFPDGARVVACLCVSYVHGRGFFQRFRYNRHRSAMQRYVRALGQGGRFPRTAPAVLPQLENVSLAHALHWATEPATRKFCRDEAQREALADRVRRLYDDRRISADGHSVPMKHLADRLKEILAAEGPTAAEAKGA